MVLEREDVMRALRRFYGGIPAGAPNWDIEGILLRLEWDEDEEELQPSPQDA